MEKRGILIWKACERDIKKYIQYILHFIFHFRSANGTNIDDNILRVFIIIIIIIVIAYYSMVNLYLFIYIIFINGLIFSQLLNTIQIFELIIR